MNHVREQLVRMETKSYAGRSRCCGIFGVSKLLTFWRHIWISQTVILFTMKNLICMPTRYLSCWWEKIQTELVMLALATRQRWSVSRTVLLDLLMVFWTTWQG